jgi:hypothetical protein
MRLGEAPYMEVLNYYIWAVFLLIKCMSTTFSEVDFGSTLVSSWRRKGTWKKWVDFDCKLVRKKWTHSPMHRVHCHLQGALDQKWQNWLEFSVAKMSRRQLILLAPENPLKHHGMQIILCCLRFGRDNFLIVLISFSRQGKIIETFVTTKTNKSLIAMIILDLSGNGVREDLALYCWSYSTWISLCVKEQIFRILILILCLSVK